MGTVITIGLSLIAILIFINRKRVMWKLFQPREIYKVFSILDKLTKFRKINELVQTMVLIDKHTVIKHVKAGVKVEKIVYEYMVKAVKSYFQISLQESNGSITPRDLLLFIESASELLPKYKLKDSVISYYDNPSIIELKESFRKQLIESDWSGLLNFQYLHRTSYSTGYIRLFNGGENYYKLQIEAFNFLKQLNSNFEIIKLAIFFYPFDFILQKEYYLSEVSAKEFIEGLKKNHSEIIEHLNKVLPGQYGDQEFYFLMHLEYEVFMKSLPDNDPLKIAATKKEKLYKFQYEYYCKKLANKDCLKNIKIKENLLEDYMNIKGYTREEALNHLYDCCFRK